MYAAISPEHQEARMKALQAEIDELQQKLGKDEDAEKIVKNHIKLLHQYNEAKDAAQLAVLTETTIRKIHEDLGLTADD